MRTYSLAIALALFASTAHAQKADREASPMMPLVKQPDLVAAPPPAIKPNVALPPAAKPNVGVLGPVEYDVPFPGKLKVIRGNKFLMTRLCPKTVMPITLGCSYTDPNKEECVVIMAEDDIILAAGWTPEITLRHEESHCNGWDHTHKGARPVTLENLANRPASLTKNAAMEGRARRLAECKALGIVCVEP
jgi:hypothetical protein